MPKDFRDLSEFTLLRSLLRSQGCPDRLVDKGLARLLASGQAQAESRCYTWRGDNCLEVADDCEVELSEWQVRCLWPTGHSLTLPVSFALDVARSRVVRRRHKRLLELHLAKLEEPLELGLSDQVVQRGGKSSGS